jgi:hypothetical protein
MINWTDEQLEEAGIDKKKLKSLVRRLRKCSIDMRELDLHVYGASGSGHLIHTSRPTHVDQRGTNGIADQGSCVADLGEGFDGGDW